jgi:hypothetical protein
LSAIADWAFPRHANWPVIKAPSPARGPAAEVGRTVSLNDCVYDAVLSKEPQLCKQLYQTAGSFDRRKKAWTIAKSTPGKARLNLKNYRSRK